LLRVLLQFVVVLWTFAVVFSFIDAAGRQWRIKRWSAKLLAICRVRLAFSNWHGGVTPPHALIVVNHVS